MKYYTLIFSILTLLLTSCSSRRDWSINNYYECGVMPGTVRISENFFVDEVEISNQYWLDFMYYQKLHWGDTSENYLAAIPDSKVWLQYSSCLDWIGETYLKHPAYRDYPVVGISQEQAHIYCKWRSDRIFELMLIRYKIIKEDPFRFFSIEKYFNGEIETISNKKIAYYPNYELPTLYESSEMKAYNQSFQLKPNKKRVIQNIVFSGSSIYCPDSVNIPMSPIYASSHKTQKKYLYNLNENVREWLREKNMAVGSSRIDSDISMPIMIESPDAATGFRCVAKWKKRGE